ncbi:TonB-dependent receptor domain-containing protein [Hymenobacter lucidus]|uniref:TonB-dependent receptor n=1 Tax=Hymenobacter lucidus TaxID=2880930 RepID=A0ABS8AXX1_9BACT|nr:TonB-dependent receptor [Hymenobacter lucidus]MCB2410666.1 TonB-dependent receptor [Hymenobacter lucidus]
MIGYSVLVKPNILLRADDMLLDVGVLRLSPSAQSLKEVVVTGQKPFIERESDRTIVNVENSLVQAGSSVMEVMEKLPGVQVGQDGSISIKGRQGLIVSIDGRPTMLSGQDLANMFRGMSSSNVQKVEIITNPSAKYDAAGNTGVINIVTKKNTKQGVNGTANLGYRQGRYAKLNSGIGLNVKDKWYNLSVNYAYSRRKDFNDLRLTRKFFEQETLDTTFVTNTDQTSLFNTHTPRVGVDLYLSKRTTVSILGSSVISLLTSPSVSHTTILNRNSKVGSYDFTNDVEDKLRIYSGNIQLTHQFDSIGKTLTAEVEYVDYTNTSDQAFLTTLNSENETAIERSRLRGDMNGKFNIYVSKADYTQALKDSATMEAGIKSSYVSNDNNNQFFDYIGGNQVFDAIRSNHFLYSENINAAYVNLKKEYHKSSFQLGLRTEHTAAHGEQLLSGQEFRRNYMQLFPSAFYEYRISDNHSLSATAGRRIDRPAYHQMNPFRSLIDATSFAQGNPSLRPQLTYNSEVTYSLQNSFFVTFGYSLTRGVITETLVLEGDSKTTILTPVNLDRLHYYSLNMVYSKALTSWWTTNSSLLGYYGRYSGNTDGYIINNGLPSFQLNSNNSLQVVNGLSMEMNVLYTHRSQEAFTVMKPQFNLSFGVQKKILKDRGSLTLNVNDLFWTSYPRGVTTFKNMQETWTSIRDTRIVSLNCSYRFGNGEVKRVRQSTATEEEMSRGGK